MEKVTVTDMARYARLWIEPVHEDARPVVVTHHGQEMAVLVPVEQYRQLVGESEPGQLKMPMGDEAPSSAA